MELLRSALESQLEHSRHVNATKPLLPHLKIGSNILYPLGGAVERPERDEVKEPRWDSGT